MSELFEIDEESTAMGRRSPAESGAVEWAANEPVPTVFNTSLPETFAGMKLIARLEQAKPESVALHLRLSESNSPVEFSTVAQIESLNTNGPRARNALPGGAVWRKQSKHFADEAEAWRRNENHPVPFSVKDVIADSAATLGGESLDLAPPK